MYRDLNSGVRDVDSHVTGFGAHNRLIVTFHRPSMRVTIREDVSGLPYSTDAQRRKAANGIQRVHPRGGLVYVGSTPEYVSDDGQRATIFHDYDVR